MRRKSGLKNILYMAALLIGGALFSKQIKEFLAKIPVVKDLVSKVDATQNVQS